MVYAEVIMANVVDSILSQPLTEYALGYRKHREDKASELAEHAAYAHINGDPLAARILQNMSDSMVEPYSGTTEEGLATIAPMGQTPEHLWSGEYSGDIYTDPRKQKTSDTKTSDTPKTKKEIADYLGVDDSELPENIMSKEDFAKQIREKIKGQAGQFSQPTKNIFEQQDPDNYVSADPTYSKFFPQAPVQVANPQTYFNGVIGQDLPILTPPNTIPQLGAMGTNSKGKIKWGKLPLNNPAAHYEKDKHGKYKLVKAW